MQFVLPMQAGKPNFGRVEPNNNKPETRGPPPLPEMPLPLTDKFTI